MGGTRPGPICQGARPVCIDDGTAVRRASPAPGALNGGAQAQAPVRLKALVFDAERVTAFLRSVAHAKSAERHIKLRWQDYDQSTVLNFIYTVLWWKGRPGWVEVDWGSARQVEAETATDTQHLFEVFLEKAAQGPRPVTEFLSAQERIRATCLVSVESVLQEARSLSREVRAETEIGIKRLAVIKAGATISVKTLGLAGGGLPSFLISAGYDVTTEVIQEWNKSSGAALVGVAVKKGAIESGKELVQKGAETVAEQFEREANAPAHKVEWLGKRLKEMEEKLAKKVTAERLKKLARDQRRLARATRAATRAQRWARAFGHVQYVFFAYDVYEALAEARKTFRAAE